MAAFGRTYAGTSHATPLRLERVDQRAAPGLQHPVFEVELAQVAEGTKHSMHNTAPSIQSHARGQEYRAPLAPDTPQATIDFPAAPAGRM